MSPDTRSSFKCDSIRAEKEPSARFLITQGRPDLIRLLIQLALARTSKQRSCLVKVADNLKTTHNEWRTMRL